MECNPEGLSVLGYPILSDYEYEHEHEGPTAGLHENRTIGKMRPRDPGQRDDRWGGGERGAARAME